MGILLIKHRKILLDHFYALMAVLFIVPCMTALSKAKSRWAGYVHLNPTTGRFGITGTSTGAKEIVVTDFSGRVLINLETDSEEPELNLSAYPDGIYIVEVLQIGLERTFKVVAE